MVVGQAPLKPDPLPEIRKTVHVCFLEPLPRTKKSVPVCLMIAANRSITLGAAAGRIFAAGAGWISMENRDLLRIDPTEGRVAMLADEGVGPVFGTAGGSAIRALNRMILHVLLLGPQDHGMVVNLL